MQKSWKYGVWTLAGVLFAGTLSQSLSNAVQVITPHTTYVGTGGLILLTIGTLLVMKWRRGIPWHYPGVDARIKNIGPILVCFVVGIILLLWYPQAKYFFDRIHDKETHQKQVPKETHETQEPKGTHQPQEPTVELKKLK